MNLRKNKTTKILIIVFAVALLIEIGYAVLSSNLKINGNTKINQARWDVHFANVQVTDGSVTADSAAAVAELDNTTVNYEVTLKNPGDFYEFTVDAVNAGTIDAMVSTIANTPLTEAQQKYLNYSVSYSDGTALAEKQILAKEKTETLKVRVEFKKDVDSADLPTLAETLTLEFKVNYAQADSTAIAIVHPVCKKATALHTEVCNQTDGTYYCSGGGYSNGATVEYGNLGTPGTALAAGDALDCDVNGDGTFDAATERFYYVSDLDSDSNYAVLVYYNNVAEGVANNTALSTYDDDNTPRANGPKTAIAELPTTEQWKKVSLSSTTRAIKDEAGATHKADFSYVGKAARLLTAQEVGAACGIIVGSLTEGELDNCKYLMENTKYTDNSLTYGYWLETVHSSRTTNTWDVNGCNRFVNDSNANNTSYLGVRPAIEVPKSKIAY